MSGASALPEGVFARLRRWARALRDDTAALYLAARDPQVPRAAKVVIAIVVAYALSPIDLIPDFIPLLGYLDDLLLLPAGIWLAVRLVPPGVWARCRAEAARRGENLAGNRRAALAIVAIWLLAALVAGYWLAGIARLAARP